MGRWTKRAKCGAEALFVIPETATRLSGIQKLYVEIPGSCCIRPGITATQSLLSLDGKPAGVTGLGAKFLLDPQQLVVFGGPVGPRQ